MKLLSRFEEALPEPRRLARRRRQRWSLEVPQSNSALRVNDGIDLLGSFPKNSLLQQQRRMEQEPTALRNTEQTTPSPSLLAQASYTPSASPSQQHPTLIPNKPYSLSL